MSRRQALLGLSLLVVAAAGAEGSAPSPPLADGEIAYGVTLRGYAFSAGAACVGRIGSPGAARRLTGIGRYQVRWSPDGRRIAIAGGTLPATRIRVANADGTASHPVSSARTGEDDSNPTWSPDGSRIAFARYGSYGSDLSRMGIWIVDLRRGEEHQITRMFAWSLDWAPTGDLIAADTTLEFPAEVVLFRDDGTPVRAFRPPGLSSFETGVSWSPDGSRLALGGGFVVDRAGHTVATYAVGSRSDLVVRSPDWSPDGSTIAYLRAPSYVYARTNVRILLPADLHSAPAAGGAETRLTQSPALDEAAPDFRPGAGAAPGGTRQSCVLSGTPGRDVLHGTGAADLVDARGGNDVVDGRGGNDLVVGGPGQDRLAGGRGRDLIDAGGGNDRLYAQDAAGDRLSGGLGRDRAWVDRRDLTQGVELRYAR
jgi:Ca2+-binding RTX toxin-like protein